jgi:hypothetical protein
MSEPGVDDKLSYCKDSELELNKRFADAASQLNLNRDHKFSWIWTAIDEGEALHEVPFGDNVFERIALEYVQIRNLAISLVKKTSSLTSNADSKVKCNRC